MASGIAFFKDLSKELERITSEVMECKEEALEQATSYTCDMLKAATPVNTGITKDSWEKIFKYTGVKFIDNLSLSKTGIPILNLLEYSRNGKPFAVKTFSNCIPNMESIITNRLNKVK